VQIHRSDLTRTWTRSRSMWWTPPLPAMHSAARSAPDSRRAHRWRCRPLGHRRGRAGTTRRGALPHCPPPARSTASAAQRDAAQPPLVATSMTVSGARAATTCSYRLARTPLMMRTPSGREDPHEIGRQLDEGRGEDVGEHDVVAALHLGQRPLSTYTIAATPFGRGVAPGDAHRGRGDVDRVGRAAPSRQAAMASTPLPQPTSSTAAPARVVARTPAGRAPWSGDRRDRRSLRARCAGTRRHQACRGRSTPARRRGARRSTSALAWRRHVRRRVVDLDGVPAPACGKPSAPA